MANPVLLENDNTPLGIGEVLVRTKTILQDAGGVIARGAVLGEVTASGKLRIAKSAAVDGSEIPRYITLQDIDAIAGDVVKEVAVNGRFNEDKLVFDGADDLDTQVSAQSYFDYLRQFGMLAVDLTNLDFFDNN